jgi:hypothetical protein
VIKYHNMFRYFTYLLVSLCFLASVRSSAQQIRGVINSYTKVVTVDTCLNELSVQSTTGFTAGSLVLLIQMQGAQVQLVNGPTFGRITTTAEAGQYEFARIFSVKNGVIRLQNKLLRSYAASAGLQLISVPVYNNVTVISTLRPKPWDGVSGGVLAFEATGTVTMQADIDASGDGFRGGNASENGGGDSETEYYYLGISANGGYKGEGIAQVQTAYEAGRGAFASGGGGGNARNSGGGGGSNGGVGGRGGDQLDQFIRLQIGGEGGHGFVTVGALFCGGGGGGGQQNDAKGSAGGNGGGIIILKSNGLVGNGYSIRANGTDAVASDGDGAGGGGAGGTIVLDIANIVNSFTLEAKGGNGGDANENFALSNCYGPGGGGGGGVIYSTAQTSFPLTSALCIEGAAGKVTNTSGACNGTTYGATPGQVGKTYEHNFSRNESAMPFIKPAVDKTTVTICEEDTAIITVSNGDTYSWAPATGIVNPTASTQRVAPSITTTYKVLITRNGCEYNDSVVVQVDPKPSSDFTGPFTICKDAKAIYSIPQVPGEQYSWTITGGTPTSATGNSIEIAWTSIGTAKIILQSTNVSCTSTTMKEVIVGDAIILLILGNNALCEGDTAVLSADKPYRTYLWSTGDTTPTIIVTKPGAYTLTITTADGCEGTSAPLIITLNPKPVLSISASSTMLMHLQDSVTLSATTGYEQYQWSTGESAETVVLKQAGVYTVTIIDSNGCSAIASIQIESFDDLPRVTLGLPTIEAAPGDHVTIPITIISSKNLEASGATDFSYTITFNRSLLAPIDNDIISLSNQRERSITKKGTRASTTILGQVSQVEFIAALGDTTECLLTLKMFTWLNGKPIETTVQHGVFKLLNVCPEGGNRLFDISGRLALQPPRPNPSSGTVVFQYELLEEGQVQLFLLDMLGRNVFTIVHGHQESGPYRVATDISSLPVGIYQCILRTPTQVRTSRVEVRR